MIFYLLYNIILHLMILVLSPALLIMMLFNMYNIRERLGFWTVREGQKPEEVVWFHAASMGEVTALATVVDEFHKAYPQLGVAVSTTTTSGQDRARELIPSAAYMFLAPLDIPWAVNRVLRRFQPSALIITETELWPNTIRRAKTSGCQIALINGRMSEKSIAGYRLVKGFMKQILTRLDLLCVQTGVDRDRFVRFGAEPEKTIILGNIKFDQGRSLSGKKKSPWNKGTLGIGPGSRVIVAGSTRPGEEELLMAGFVRIQEAEPSAVLIIAPRHLDRLSEVEQLLTDGGHRYLKRTQIDDFTSIDSGYLLVDTMGELSDMYALADLAFIGGSLVPLGGHNPLEPAMWGIPVLFGPYRDNVRQQTDWLIQEQGGIEIQDARDFAETVLRLLRDPEEREMRGQAALKVVEEHSGISTRTVRFLRDFNIF